jgi:hypothetical protein
MRKHRGNRGRVEDSPFADRNIVRNDEADAQAATAKANADMASQASSASALVAAQEDADRSRLATQQSDFTKKSRD